MKGLTKNKGKCYSKVDRGQRNTKDFYQTPYKMTEALMDLKLFPRNYSVLEPACGKYAIVDIISKHFDLIQYYDLYPMDHGVPKDFFAETRLFDCVITNPPFKLANEFIIHAKKVAVKQIAMLLPLNYLQGQKRYDGMFNNDNEFPLSAVHIFTRMPMLKQTVREDGKYQTGMSAYAWYIWDVKHIGQPEIHWINSKDHIARKNE